MKVYKYQVPIADMFSLDLPKGAKILSFHFAQHEQPNIWALVDETQEATERRDFFLAGTGHPVPNAPDLDLTFIGTALMAGGALVWHLFEARHVS
jgi:hypothetical protein